MASAGTQAWNSGAAGRRHQTPWLLMALAGAGSAVVVFAFTVCAGVAVWALSPAPGPGDSPPLAGALSDSTTPARIADSAKVADSAKPAADRLAADGQPAVETSRDGAAFNPVADPVKPPTAPPLAEVYRFGPAENLLEHARRETRLVRGSAQFEGSALVTEAGRHTTLSFPFAPPANYQVELDVARLEGNDSVGLTLVVGGRQAAAIFDGWPTLGHLSGLDFFQGQRLDSPLYPGARRGSLLTNNRPARLVCTVYNNTARLECDGAEVYLWKGDPATLAIHPHYQIPEPDRLALTAHMARYRVSRAELRPILGLVDGSASARPTDLPAALTPAAETPSASLPRSGKPLNLLSTIDPVKNLVKGRAPTVASDRMVLDPGVADVMVSIPVVPPERYRMTLAGKRTRGVEAIFVVFLVEGKQALFLVDGYQQFGFGSAIEQVDGRRAFESGYPLAYHKGKLLENDRPFTAVLEVNGRKTRAWVDGKEVANADLDPARYSLPHMFRVSTLKGMAVGAWQSAYVVDRFELEPL